MNDFVNILFESTVIFAFFLDWHPPSKIKLGEHRTDANVTESLVRENCVHKIVHYNYGISTGDVNKMFTKSFTEHVSISDQ